MNEVEQEFRERLGVLSLRTKLEIGAGVLLLLFAVFYAWEWHQDAIRQAQASVTQQLNDRQAKEIDARAAERDRKYDDDRAQILALIAAMQKQTPAQVVAQQPKFVELPKPIYIQGPEPQAVKIGDGVIPQESIKPLFQELGEGRVCKVDLAKCADRLADTEHKLVLKTEDAEQWKKASQGGSKFKRAMSTALKVGVGVGIGYLARR